MDAKVSDKTHWTSTDKPSEADAEAAVRTLLAWAGDDPRREGLRDTPRRVTKAFREYFSGYGQDPADILDRVFEEVGGYDDMVMLKDIPFTSHCEHHIAPFFGRAHVAYLPMGGVVELVLRRTVREVLSCVDLFTTLIFLSLAILPSNILITRLA